MEAQKPGRQGRSTRGGARRRLVEGMVDHGRRGRERRRRVKGRGPVGGKAGGREDPPEAGEVGPLGPVGQEEPTP